VKTLPQWLSSLPAVDALAPRRLLLSLREGTQTLRLVELGSAGALFLSGPEGGLGSSEEAAAVAAGFAPVTLGARVLRSETAAITALALLA
jgi:16S rRNA (uracil1498-N3)-methyltransferase